MRQASLRRELAAQLIDEREGVANKLLERFFTLLRPLRIPCRTRNAQAHGPRKPLPFGVVAGALQQVCQKELQKGSRGKFFGGVDVARQRLVKFLQVMGAEILLR